MVEQQEPINEVVAILNNWVDSLKKFFAKNNHSDLRHAYGSECATVLLREVKHPDHYFYLKSGLALKSLCDLESVLLEIDNETFSHHVKEGQNDFAKWVRDTIGDEKLASKLELLDAKEDMAKAVSVRVAAFKRRIQ